MGEFTTGTAEKRHSDNAPASAPRLTASSPRASELRECARRLHVVARKSEEFLRQQLQQLEEWSQRCQEGRADAASPADFDRQNAAWEQQIRGIEQEREQLADAWIRLESEQRKLVAERRSWAQASAGIGDSVGDDRSRDLAQPPAASHESIAVTDMERSQPVPPQEVVLVQFEQIKNDVRKHARRCRST